MRFRTRVFAALFVLVAYSVLKVIELWPAHPLCATWVALGLFGFIIVWQWLGHHPRYDFNDRAWYRILIWTASSAMSVLSIFIPLSFVTDLIYIVVRLVAGSKHLSASGFTFRYLEIVVLAVSLLITAIGYIVTRLGPKIRNVTVHVDKLPLALHGFKIAQISDLHVGSTIRRRYVEQVVNRVNSTNADIIAVTGDLVDGWADRLGPHLEPLADLQSRHGVYYVTGNHEYYWDAKNLLGAVQEFGFIPLLNANTVLRVGDAELQIAGITDPAGRMLSKDHVPNIEQSLATERKPHLRVLLSHRPNIYREAEERGFDLQLSGHTHGGQYFPYNLVIRLFHNFHRGLYRHKNLHVYVNPGSGYWAPANRFAVRAEISVITLSQSET